MLSAITNLLLGCWVAKESGVFRELPAPKISISVNPSKVITLGGNATIQCECQCTRKKLILCKNDIPLRELWFKNKNEFNIGNADLGDGGDYSCQYWPKTKQETLVKSEHLKIFVADPRYPIPSINLSPKRKLTIGQNVTIQCLGGSQDVEFFLYKDGNMTLLQPMVSAGNMTELFIRSVRQADGGRYQCFYQKKSEPFVCSYHSYPMQLVVIDYTNGNIFRLTLSVLILLFLVLIIAEAVYSW